MITTTARVVAGTLAISGLAFALAACSSSPGASSASLSPLERDMVAAHPACQGRTAVAEDQGVTCAADGKLWVLYGYPSRAAADAAVPALRTIHPTGSLSVEDTAYGARVWVTE